MADTTLILKTMVEGTAEARKGLDDVTKGINGIGDSTKKLDTLSDKLEKNAAGFAVIGAAAAAAFYAFTRGAQSAIKASTDQENALIGLRSIVEGTGQDFGSAKDYLNKFTADGLVPLGDAATSLKNLLARGFGLKEATVIMDNFKDSAAFGRQASLSMGDAIRGATEGIKNGNPILVDNVGITTNMSKMWEVYAKTLGTTAAKLTDAQKRQAELNGIMEDNKYRVGDAAKLSESYSGAVSRSAAAVVQLKVAVGDTLKPAMEAFYNIVTPLIVKVTEFAKAYPNLTAGIIWAAIAIAGLITALSALALGVMAATKAIAALKIGGEALSLLWSGKLIPMARTVGLFIAGISAPVWLTIAAIAALIAIGVLLYKNWDTITKKSAESWAKVRQVQITEGMTIGKAWDMLWNAMGQTVSEIWAAIKRVVVIGIQGVVAAINFVIRRANDISRLGNLLVPGDPIKIFEEIDPDNAVAGVKSAVVGVYNYASGALKGVANEAVATTKATAKEIEDALAGKKTPGGSKKALEALAEKIRDVKMEASGMNAEFTEKIKTQKASIVGLLEEYNKMKSEFVKIRTRGLEELNELQKGFTDLQNKGMEEMKKLQEGFTELKNKGIQEIQSLRDQIAGLNTDLSSVQSTGISDIAKRAISAQRELQKIAGIAKESDVLLRAQSMSREELMAFSAQGKAFDVSGQKVTADNLIKVLDLTREIALAKTMVTEEDIKNAEVSLNRTDVEKIIEKMNLDKVAINAKIASIEAEIVKKQELHTIELTQYQDRMAKSKVEFDKEIAQAQAKINRKITDNAIELAEYTELMKKKETQLKSEAQVYADLVKQKRILDNNYFAYFGEQIQKQISQVDALISKMNSLGGGLAFRGISGARADGGPVKSGESYLVGERGPELFTPAGHGNIIPNSGLGRKDAGSGVNIYFTGTFGKDAAESIGDMIMEKLARSVAI